MKKVLKFLLVPLAFSCCSMSANATNLRFAAFSISKEDNTNLYLQAYVNIYIRNPDKMCRYQYYWIESNGTSHKCGNSALPSLFVTTNQPFVESYAISKDELKRCSPITFMCEATISGDPTYRTTMTYNTITKDEFTISESVNNQEFSTGYLKQSTFPDASKNYVYEDAFSFLNYEDLRVNELYYDIDISYLRFKYRNGLDDTLKGKFKFAFYDRYNLFPDFEVGEESMYRYIPLTFNRDNDECYFTFTPTIYYDPITHVSSLTQKENYIPYHHLMLPFEYANELKFLPCYIKLEVTSHTNFTIYGKFMMTYLRKYFGDCEDSEFCDQMHQDDEINIREKVVEVTI